MPPVGLLAIVALGLVFAFALPERVREPGQYGVVRTESRFRADMRVIQESAARVEAVAVKAPSAKAARTLAPRKARASIKALGGSVMSRPAAPLDRAATIAQRQAVSMHRDRARMRARRAAQARRRALVGTVAAFSTAVTGGLVIASAWPLWSVVAALTTLGGITVAGRRAVRAQAIFDARLESLEREVTTTATATSALRRVVTERAAGRNVLPSWEETQAIQVVTRVAEPSAPDTIAVPTPALPEKVADPGWSPGMLPIPAYTLKPAAKVKSARPISSDDLALGTRNAELVAERREAAVAARAEVGLEPEASTETLEDILKRRRRQTA